MVRKGPCVAVFVAFGADRDAAGRVAYIAGSVGCYGIFWWEVVRVGTYVYSGPGVSFFVLVGYDSGVVSWDEVLFFRGAGARTVGAVRAVFYSGPRRALFVLRGDIRHILQRSILGVRYFRVVSSVALEMGDGYVWGGGSCCRCSFRDVSV